MRSLVLATRNRGKVAEMAALLRPFHIDVIGLDAFPDLGEIPETGATFEENALLKARAACAHAGLPALADDSGLEVDALGGSPGVRSARYAGDQATDGENNAKLLAELAHIPSGRRTARFRCVLAAATPDGRTLVARGAWEGCIALAPCGQGGFGYDPLFLVPELDKTAAQLSKEEKNARSHRGQALRRLLEQWEAFWAAGGGELPL